VYIYGDTSNTVLSPVLTQWHLNQYCFYLWKTIHDSIWKWTDIRWWDENIASYLFISPSHTSPLWSL